MARKVKPKDWFVFVDETGIVEGEENEIIVFPTIEEAKKTWKQVKEDFPDFDAEIAKLNYEVVSLLSDSDNEGD